MEIAIITSARDAASMNIRRALLEKGFSQKGDLYTKGRFSLHTLSGTLIRAEHLDNDIKADAFIFASRHASSSGRPSLSVHAPGNFGKAEMGGTPGSLCIAPCLLMKQAYMALAGSGAKGYDITMEATHHGPFVSTPCLFIEIGSAEAQWADKTAGDILAGAILSLGRIGHSIPAIGLGGTHYCSAFNALQAGSDYALGHICPKYALDHLDAEMLSQMIEKTTPQPQLAILDWKGLGKHKQRVMSLLEEKKINSLKA